MANSITDVGASRWPSSVNRSERSEPAKFKGAVEGKRNYEVKPLFQVRGLVEGSDLFSLPGGRFGAVSDLDDKVFFFNQNGMLPGTLDLPRLQNGSSQLEAAVYMPFEKKFAVVREEARELLIYDFDADHAEHVGRKPKRIQLPPFGGDRSRSNKGVEGMTYLPGEVSPTQRPQLLLANEAIPRKLYLLETTGKATGEKQKIDGKETRMPVEVQVEVKVREYCRDFSAMTVDPKTGDVFIASDESRTVVQLHLKRDGKRIIAEYVERFELERPNGEELDRIEGLSFDPDGNLLVMSENKSKVFVLERKSGD